ncbi:MAG: WD40/YVTN/BNR-like repeat-containing protein [Polyangiaceae bacterium]
MTGCRALRLASLLAGAACAGCGSSSPAPQGGAPASWNVLLSGLQATLLCVWGTSASDVFAVGGALGDGTPSAFLHYDGARWTDLVPGGTETFWWANGTSASDVWAVGERGRIVHWDGAHFTEYISGTTATLWGVWAAATNDVWAVGGTPGAGTSAPNDVVIHFDGVRWTSVPMPQALGRALFKVWGSASDNLYIVGEAGTIWHHRGVTWTLESMPPLASGSLLTVNGCGADDVYAVGGDDVLQSNGATWSRIRITLDSQVNGVSCASPGHVVVVGFGGLKERLDGGAWQDDFAEAPHMDMHGAWADPTGAYWAAGGDFSSPARDGGPPRGGFVAYYGATPPAGTLGP